MTNVDVVIVGAGATGLTLACDLVRRGLTVQLVERGEAIDPEARSVALHARTLELLEPIGVTDALVAKGKPLHGVTVWSGGQPVVRADFDELDTRFTQLLSIESSELEQALTARLEALGGSVERGASVTGFRQDGTGVTVRVRRGETDSTVRAAWLVGCDGPDSTVRASLGIAFEGDAAHDDYVVADLTIAWDVRDDRVNAYVTDDGLLACLPLPGGRYRVAASLPPEARSAQATPTLEDLQTLFARYASVNAVLREARSIERVTVAARQVANYRDDRVFLAGSAAHSFGPQAAQGANAGIQDALNLGWKLAFVHRGDARGLLLDTYEEERRAAGRALLKSTDAAVKVSGFKGSLARAARHEMARYLTSFEIVQQRIARDVADLSVGYERSRIVREDKTSLLDARLGTASGGETPTLGSVRDFAVAPSAGQRLPDGKTTLAGRGGTQRLYALLDGTKHALLLFDGKSDSADGYARLAGISTRVRDAYGSAVDVWIVTPRGTRPADVPADVPVLLDPDGDLEKRFAATTECLYLARPDFYIAYRSQPANEGAVLAYLASVLRPSV